MRLKIGRTCSQEVKRLNLLQDAIDKIKCPDKQAGERVKEAFAQRGGLADDWGEIADLTARYAAARGCSRLAIPRKAVVLMAADHGVAARGVSAFSQEVTVQMVCGYLAGCTGANVMARHAGAELIIVDVGVKGDLPLDSRIMDRKVARGTADFACGPAMSRSDAVKALEAGIEVAYECAANGVQLLGLAEMGIGNTTSSAAITSVMCNLPVDQSVGRGSGVGDQRLQIKKQAVLSALAVNHPSRSDALDVLSKVGGFEIAGLAGVILGGAACRVPVFVDGIITTAAALIAQGLQPLACEYMLGSHLSAEPAHREMLGTLGLSAPLNLGMRLGEGTGASLGMTLLDAGIAIAKDVFGNGEAGVVGCEE